MRSCRRASTGILRSSPAAAPSRRPALRAVRQGSCSAPILRRSRPPVWRCCPVRWGGVGAGVLGAGLHIRLGMSVCRYAYVRTSVCRRPGVPGWPWLVAGGWRVAQRQALGVHPRLFWGPRAGAAVRRGPSWRGRGGSAGHMLLSLTPVRPVSAATLAWPGRGDPAAWSEAGPGQGAWDGMGSAGWGGAGLTGWLIGASGAGVAVRSAAVSL